MNFAGFGQFNGAFSGVPLEVVFTDEENEIMEYECVIHLEFKYNTIRFTGFAYKKRVQIRVNYVYDGVFPKTNIIVDAIFKDLVNSLIEEQENISFDIEQLLTQSYRINVEAKAEYYDRGRGVHSFLKGEDGQDLVIKQEFVIRPATFNVFYFDERHKGIRIFRRFSDGEGNPIKTYTTYFKNFPPPKDLFVWEDEKGVTKIISDSRTLIYNSINYMIDRVIEDECGVYLIWQNEGGGVSCWLFSPNYKEEIKTKSLGNFLKGYKTDFDYPLIRHFGVTATKTWTLHSDIAVMSEEVEELQGLLKSRYVYLYTGKYNREIWKRVMVQEGAYKFDVNTQDTHPFTVTIEFEQLRTATSI